MTKNKKVLSIQLSLSGLSFCVYDDSAQKIAQNTILFDVKNTLTQNLTTTIEKYPQLSEQYSRVNIVIDTDKVVYVPSELFETQLARSYVATNGIQLSDNDTIVSSTQVDGVHSVMVIAQEALHLLSGQYPQASYYSPLQENLMRKRPNTLEVNLTRHNAYITCHDTTLQYADAMPYSTQADVLFYIKQALGERKAHLIYIVGQNAGEMAKLCRRYHKSVNSEQPTNNYFGKQCV